MSGRVPLRKLPLAAGVKGLEGTSRWQEDQLDTTAAFMVKEELGRGWKHGVGGQGRLGKSSDVALTSLPEAQPTLMKVGVTSVGRGESPKRPYHPRQLDGCRNDIIFVYLTQGKQGWKNPSTHYLTW